MILSVPPGSASVLTLLVTGAVAAAARSPIPEVEWRWVAVPHACAAGAD